MNISEANATATVLEFAAGLSRPGVGPVSLDRAVAAGRFLAERVHKALYAGPDPDDVAAGLTEAAARRGHDTGDQADDDHADRNDDGRGWAGPWLPTFEDIRFRAYATLGDAADWLRSDWRPGTGPTTEAGHAVSDAFAAIGHAKAALNRAAAAMDRGQ